MSDSASMTRAWWDTSKVETPPRPMGCLCSDHERELREAQGCAMCQNDEENIDLTEALAAAARRVEIAERGLAVAEREIALLRKAMQEILAITKAVQS